MGVYSKNALVGVKNFVWVVSPKVIRSYQKLNGINFNQKNPKNAKKFLPLDLLHSLFRLQQYHHGCFKRNSSLQTERGIFFALGFSFQKEKGETIIWHAKNVVLFRDKLRIISREESTSTTFSQSWVLKLEFISISPWINACMNRDVLSVCFFLRDLIKKFGLFLIFFYLRLKLLKLFTGDAVVPEFSTSTTNNEHLSPISDNDVKCALL